MRDTNAAGRRSAGRCTLGGKTYSVEASFVKWLPSADGPERVSLVAPYCAALVHVAYMRDRSAHGENAGDSTSEEEDN